MKSFSVLLGMAVALAVSVASLATSPVASAQTQSAPGQVKKYKATRPIVIDAQTGALRLPTQQEIDDTVANLTKLTQRPDDSLPAANASSGVAIDLDGGFAGVMLARPNEDGTLETKCVFTFEEGAEFLGLVVASEQ